MSKTYKNNNFSHASSYRYVSSILLFRSSVCCHCSKLSLCVCHKQQLVNGEEERRKRDGYVLWWGYRGHACVCKGASCWWSCWWSCQDCGCTPRACQDFVSGLYLIDFQLFFLFGNGFHCDSLLSCAVYGLLIMFILLIEVLVFLFFFIYIWFSLIGFCLNFRLMFDYEYE